MLRYFVVMAPVSCASLFRGSSVRSSDKCSHLATFFSDYYLYICECRRS